MTALIISLSILGVFFLVALIFVGKELLKKFYFLNNFFNKSGYIKRTDWDSPVKEKGEDRIIRFRSKDSFNLLILFKFDFFKKIFGEKVDPFKQGEAILSNKGYYEVILLTYLKNTVSFIIMTISEKKDFVMEIEEGEYVQDLIPQLSCPAHWFQKIGGNILQKNKKSFSFWPKIKQYFRKLFLK